MQVSNEHYDYILFENYQLATHHLYDVKLIAKMLQTENLSVAIFDLYGQFDPADADGIPIIKWSPKNRLPDITWMKRQHSKLESLSKSLMFIRHRHAFLKEAMAFIKEQADNFYCGSLYNGMPTLFFELDKPCYWWGLRSSRMVLVPRNFIKSPLVELRKLVEKHRFIRNPYQRLFVSNRIILEEFVDLGIPRDRISIREERSISEIGSGRLDKLSPGISFLVIGMLRTEKNVPLTITAFEKANVPDSTLKLVGRSSAGYEEVIKKAMGKSANIERQNKYLEYTDFNESFQNSHFVLFADEEGPSCITNGTFTEALINHRPVVCPDCQPYTYYIDKFGVGIIYKKGDADSYAEALIKASNLGVGHFLNNIDRFLETILFDKAAKELIESINHNNETLQ